MPHGGSRRAETIHWGSRSACNSFVFSAQMVKVRPFMLSHLPLVTNLGDPEGFAICVLEPFDSLQLRVNHERPALAVGEDGGILHGHAVCREALVLPGGHVGIVRQHPQGIQGGGEWDGNLTMEKCHPLSECKHAFSAGVGYTPAAHYSDTPP